LIVSEAS
jgi:L-glyceraldehyde 3-phosphate reductase